MQKDCEMCTKFRQFNTLCNLIWCTKLLRWIVTEGFQIISFDELINWFVFLNHSIVVNELCYNNIHGLGCWIIVHYSTFSWWGEICTKQICTLMQKNELPNSTSEFWLYKVLHWALLFVWFQKIWITFSLDVYMTYVLIIVCNNSPGITVIGSQCARSVYMNFIPAITIAAFLFTLLWSHEHFVLWTLGN